tara:strand:- start:1928 stop:3844 length:1917 start_codon:yes stop_codon:yes gene_type:complete
MATGQTDRELLLALMRNSGVIPNLDPFTYPQNAPNVPKEFGQEVLEFAQALERDPNRRATGLEEVVELIGKMGVINPLKTVGSLMQLDKPTVERMAQSGVEAAKRAYDDPPGTASRLAQGAKEALLDPVSTAGELSVSDIAGGSGLLSKLAGGSSLTGPALMAAMVPGSDVPRPKRSESMGFKDPNKFGTLEEPTPFSEQDYPYTESVVVEFPDGDTFVEQIKGLNSGHALERAKINFDGAKVRKATRSEELMQEQLDRGETPGALEIQRLEQKIADMPNYLDDSDRKALRNLRIDKTKAQVALDDVELARLDRAIQQGFNIDAFHGTKADISSFDPGLLGVTTEAESARKGFFFARDAEVAETYADYASAEDVRKELFDPDIEQKMRDKQLEIVDEIEKIEDLFFKKENRNDGIKFVEQELEDINNKLKNYSNEIEKINSARNKKSKSDKSKKFLDVTSINLREEINSIKYDKREVEDFLYNLKNDSDYVPQMGVPLPKIRKLYDQHDSLEEQADIGAYKGQGNNIIPVKLKLENPLIYDFKGNSFRDITYDNLLKEAKSKGHDGVIFRNTYDGIGIRDNKKTDVYVVFEPEQIRSRFATFDPEKTGSKNILASVPPVLFPLGVGAAAASYSANKEE